MRVEVDEDLLTGLRGRDHPYALLGGRVGAGVARGGQVVRGVDLYGPPAFICAAREGRKLVSSGWEEEEEEGRQKIDFPATELDIDRSVF